MKTKLTRLIELNAKTDELMEFMDRETFKQRYGVYPEEATPDPEQVASQKKVIRATATGAGLVGAGFLGQRAVTNAGGYSAVASKVGAGIAPVMAAVKPKLASAGAAVGKLAAQAPSKIAALLAKLKGVRFESREARLIQLNSQLGETIEFMIAPEPFVKAAGVLAGVIAGGNIGRIASKKKYNQSTGQWEDASGKPVGKINWPVEGASLAGGGAVIAGIHAAPTIKRKAKAAASAFDKAGMRAVDQGAFPFKTVGRAIKSGIKAARYA